MPLKRELIKKIQPLLHRGEWNLFILAGCLLLPLFVGLACSLPSERAADALDATKVALEVEATTLAIEKAVLTQQAALLRETSSPQPALSTDTPLPTVLTPTDTTTPMEEAPEDADQPVEGSLVRAPFDPAYGWGSGNDTENFDGVKGLFPSSTAGAATAWYADGQYHISFTSRARWTWYWTFLDAKDFYMDVVITNGDKCVSGDTAGMVFRGDAVGDYGVMFGISCGGQYFIGFTVVPGTDGFVCAYDGATIDCVNRELMDSSLIDTGPGAVNRIGVMAQGDGLDFYINGRWVDEVSVAMFAPLFQDGVMALYLGTAQKPDAKVSFDDFNIWYLD